MVPDPDRFRRVWCALAASLALLAGCTVSTTAPPTTPAADPPVTDPASPSMTPTGSLTASVVPRAVVGLGDSIMAGTNCHCGGPLEAYADLLAERGPRPATRNLAVPGWTTGDVLHQLATDARARRAVAEADTIVIIVGANDLFRMGLHPTPEPASTALPDGLVSLRERLDAVLAAVWSARDGRPATILMAGYWDVLSRPGEESPWSALTIDAVNATIRAAAEAAGARYVDLDTAFARAGGAAGIGTLISDDGLHPNADGAAAIGSAFAVATP